MQRTLGLAAIVLVLDQVSKWVILALVMQPPRVIEVLPVFNLVLTYNTGVSFGVFAGDAAWQPWVLSAVSLAIVVGLLVWMRYNHNALILLGVGLIVGGAIGNVVDRIRLGAVVDFLDVHVAGWHWPAFNLADSAISIGVALLVIDALFQPGNPSKK